MYKYSLPFHYGRFIAESASTSRLDRDWIPKALEPRQADVDGDGILTVAGPLGLAIGALRIRIGLRGVIIIL